jgi:hypothetical protein
MAITIRDTPSSSRADGRIKRSNASLVGGIVIGVGIFVLWMLIAVELGYAAGSAPTVIGGLLLGAGTGAWVRLADL